MNQRILFVDDDPSVLAAYRAIFRYDQSGREVAFAKSGKDALDLMSGAPFDIVVSDMQMPEMSGADLLAVVAENHPQTSRLIVSGYTDSETVVKCLASTHQFIAKPFHFRELTDTLDFLRSLGEMLKDERHKKLVGRISDVRSLPKLYFEIIEVLDSPDPSLDAIADIIGRDPGMTAKILQIANSAFFGAKQRILTVKEAIQHLGLSLIRELVLGHQIFASFDPKRIGELALERIWNHSLATSFIASRIAWIETHDQTIVDASATAGILHDIGKLILADGWPEEYAAMLVNMRDGNYAQFEAEKQSFGVSHAEIGAYLLGQWGLPLPLVEAVAHHHNPSRAGNEEFSAVTAVHVASAIENERSNLGSVAIDTEYLASIGVDQRLAEWRQVAGSIDTTSFD